MYFLNDTISTKRKNIRLESIGVILIKNSKFHFIFLRSPAFHAIESWFLNRQ
jgi:hypothetical protein